MYFGALSIGADFTAGLLVLNFLKKHNSKAKLVFKNPQKHELVIFDDESIIDFKNFIYHYNFFVLQSRIGNINKIYFSFC